MMNKEEEELKEEESEKKSNYYFSYKHTRHGSLLDIEHCVTNIAPRINRFLLSSHVRYTKNYLIIKTFVRNKQSFIVLVVN